MTVARIRALTALALTVTLGLATKVYRGPFEDWIAGSGGGAFYVLFFALVPALVDPEPVVRTRRDRFIVLLSATVLGAVVELSQLWHPEWLEAWRRRPVVGLVLGSRFSVVDLPAYPLGGLLGVPLLAWVARGLPPADGDPAPVVPGRPERAE